MTSAPPDAMTLRYARGKLAGCALGGFAFVALCVWLIWSGIAAHGSFKQAIMAVGVVFFGAVGLYAIRQMFIRDPAVVISLAGIMDSRISESIIPWPAILDIDIREVHRQKFLLLQLDPAFKKTMKQTRTASIGNSLNAAIGYQGVALNVAGLEVHVDEVPRRC
jgi:hypothetical protein